MVQEARSGPGPPDGGAEGAIIGDSSAVAPRHIARQARQCRATTRVAKNAVSNKVVAIERRGGAKFEDVKDLVAGARGKVVYEQGDPDNGFWSAARCGA